VEKEVGADDSQRLMVPFKADDAADPDLPRIAKMARVARQGRHGAPPVEEGRRSVELAVIGCRGFPSRYGGFETFIRRLAPYLRATGVGVTVYGRGPGKRTMISEVDGVRCIQTVGVERRATSTLTYGLSAAIDAAQRKPDAALVLNVANGFYLPMLRRAGIPTAVNVDGMEWERAKWSAAGQQMFRWGASLTARYADSIVVDSQAIGDVWRSRFGVESTFIPYGATLGGQAGSAKLRNLGIEPGTYALAVARLVPENNVELLLEALRRRRETLATVVVGSASGPSVLESELRRLSEAQPNFHWLGHVNDDDLLAQLWTHCRVYFHGHSVGGTNPALLQALACGSPTIALDTPFNREVIDHPDNLTVADPALLAAKIAAVVNDAPLRAAMAERGRAIVTARYLWEDVCRRYADLLLSLAGRTETVPRRIVA
jgi:glycosyltransferase involved in cell wall biosynthesis